MKSVKKKIIDKLIMKISSAVLSRNMFAIIQTDKKQLKG